MIKKTKYISQPVGKKLGPVYWAKAVREMDTVSEAYRNWVSWVVFNIMYTMEKDWSEFRKEHFYTLEKGSRTYKKPDNLNKLSNEVMKEECDKIKVRFRIPDK